MRRRAAVVAVIKLSSRFQKNLELKMPYQLMQFNNMTMVELERRDCELLQEITHIKAQLEFASLRTTKYTKADASDWHFRANLALRIKGREHQLLTQELSIRRNAAKQALALNSALRFERCFMAVAWSRLTPELYSELMEATHVVYGNEQKDQPMPQIRHPKWLASLIKWPKRVLQGQHRLRA
jgi:hypothetical protein